MTLTELDLHRLPADSAGFHDWMLKRDAASSRAVAGQDTERAGHREIGAALLALDGVECLPKQFRVTAGDGGDPRPGWTALISGRSCEEAPQVGRRKAVGAGEAGDEGIAAFTGNRPDLEGELGDRLAARGGVGHLSASGRPRW